MNDLKKMKLLYVEDELEVSAQYLRYFQTKFESVYTAEDGKKAIELYEDLKPDVVILDIDIPLINGLDVAKKIRLNDNTTQLILLTAKSDKQSLLKAIELGLITYLEKPVSREVLKEALLKLCETDKRILCKFDDKEYLWNIQKAELNYNDEVIKLTKNEAKLFQLFVNKKSDNVSYQEVYEEISFGDNGKKYSEQAIKALIKALRSKLPKNAVKNIYGVGYFIDFK
ncbi:MAG: response regulator [Helicobacteraceae bacterium]|nr:response regulator [Helicobacteraceae bacterium]